MSDILRTLLEQEQVLQFSHFTPERAWELGCALKAAAQGQGASLAIDITLNDLCIFHYVMPGACANNVEWVRRKRNSVKRFHHSTWYLGNLYKAKGKSMYEDSGISVDDYACHGGSFPLTMRKVGVVGSITVSGLPQEEDHDLIVGVLTDFLEDAEKQTA